MTENKEPSSISALLGYRRSSSLATGPRDAQQLCRGGHVLNVFYHDLPAFRRGFCSACGAPSLHACEACGWEILGGGRIDKDALSRYPVDLRPRRAASGASTGRRRGEPCSRSWSESPCLRRTGWMEANTSTFFVKPWPAGTAGNEYWRAAPLRAGRGTLTLGPRDVRTSSVVVVSQVVLGAEPDSRPVRDELAGRSAVGLSAGA